MFEFNNEDDALKWLLSYKFNPNVRIIRAIDKDNNKVELPALGLDITFVVFNKDIKKMASQTKKLIEVLSEIDAEFLENNNLKSIMGD